MIQMVDLRSQYQRLQSEINAGMAEVLDSCQFIGGHRVIAFQNALEQYLNIRHVIPCANGTDALQIAMMALELKPGDEVIVPAITYVATAEVIGLLGLTPVMTDVDPDTFNITARHIEAAITPRTKAIVPVHLFFFFSDMEAILEIARKYELWVIEDNAQAIGSDYAFSDGRVKKTGTMGHIGCTSFFPSKNLGCYGDGGALMTDDDELAAKIRMIANHGQSKQYYHEYIGVNSRLDALQAVVLHTKLKHLDEFNTARRTAADFYDRAFAHHPHLKTPVRSTRSTHVFHQYTLQVDGGQRDALKKYLNENDVSAMIYYPVPLYDQKAFNHWWNGIRLPVTEHLCHEVISLPMHSEMTQETLQTIAETVEDFFK